MGEKQKIVGKSFAYEGMFVFKHFFYEMDVWFRENWYDKFEKLNEQKVRPDGTKQMAFEFIPWKKFTDYFKGAIKTEVMATDIKDVEVEYNSQKANAQQGRIEVKFTGYLFVDYPWFFGSKWSNPVFYFIRDLFDKYAFYRYTKKYKRMVVEDVERLSTAMQSYLNSQEYQLWGYGKKAPGFYR